MAVCPKCNLPIRRADAYSVAEDGCLGEEDVALLRQTRHWTPDREEALQRILETPRRFQGPGRDPLA